jgi:hypothetical protein
MPTLTQHLALVSESKKIKSADLLKVAAALQKQATRDLAPIWEAAATVSAFEKLEDVPIGYWPMIVMDNIGVNGAAGIHLDKDNQPYALITASTEIDQWSVTAAHEMCEMLVDPYGNRVIAGDSPKDGQGRVSFLVEVCDPSEAAEFAYTVNGVLVSDFYTPSYFDPIAAPGVRYSFTGALTEPRQVRRGGYLSWEDAVTTHWWQEIWRAGADEPSFRDIGPLDPKAGSLRAQIDRLTAAETAQAVAPARSVATAAGLSIVSSYSPSTSKAAMWRELIGALTDGPSPNPESAASASPQVRRAKRIRGD